MSHVAMFGAPRVLRVVAIHCCGRALVVRGGVAVLCASGSDWLGEAATVSLCLVDNEWTLWYPYPLIISSGDTGA